MNNNVNMAGIKKILIKVIFCVSFLLCVPSYVMAADSTKDTVEIETVFSDVDNAAAALRDNMEKRITRTALYYQVEKNEMTNTEIKEYGEELHQKIYLEAMKHTGDPEGGDYIYWSLYFISKNPGSTTYQLDGDMVVYRLYYYSSYRTTTEQEAEAQIEFDRIMEKLDLDGASDYEKVIYISNYIISNVDYDRDNDNIKYTGYAALINKSAVCEGQALLFYRMANAAGVDTRVVTGSNHAWNLVKLDDKYYYVDVTNSGLYSSDSYVHGQKELKYAEAVVVNDLMEKVDPAQLYDVAESHYEAEATTKKITEGDFQYSIYRNKATLTKYTGKDYTVVVPATVQGYPVKTISKYAFWGVSSDSCGNYVEKIVFSEGIEQLNYCCISFCSKLEEVVIPSTMHVQYWDEYDIWKKSKKILNSDALFDCCSNLTKITVSKDNEYIKSVDDVLYSKDGRLLIYYPAGKKVDDYSILEGTETVLSYAFPYVTGIKNIIFPEGLLEIKDHAFYSCRCESLHFPNTLTYFNHIYNDFGKYHSINIPDNIEDVEYFTYPDSLEEIIVSDNHKKYMAIDGVLITKDEDGNPKELVKYPGAKADEKYIIPGNVTSVATGAFYGSNTKEIVLSDSVIEISDKAFDGKYLKTVSIPKSVVTIGDDIVPVGTVIIAEKDSYAAAYAEEKGLGLITNGEIAVQGSCGDSADWSVAEDGTLTITGSGVISDYDADSIPWASYRKYIKVIDIKEGIEGIGKYAFANMYNVEAINIPKSLKEIGAYSCGSFDFNIFNAVNYYGTEDDWKEIQVGSNNTYMYYKNRFNYLGKDVTGEPTSEEPTSEELTSEEPTSEEPTSEELTSEEPTSEEPTSEEPTSEALTSEEPTSEEPTSEEPTSEKPTSEEPTSEEPTSEEPTGQELTSEEPTGEGPTSEEPTGEGSTSEEPTSEGLTSEEPTSGQSAGELSTTEHKQSISDQQLRDNYNTELSNDVTADTDRQTTFNIKSNKIYKKSKKISITEPDGIKSVKLNNKIIKIKKGKKDTSFKLSKYKKYLKSRKNWNKLVVTDMKSNIVTIKFKVK